MKSVGIIGGSGFAAGELIRLLLHHPGVHLAFVHSQSCAGKMVADIHSDLFGVCSLPFVSEIEPQVDVVFMCKGHGDSRPFLESSQFGPQTVVIDLSQDFRTNNEPYDFVYGLPELHRKQIQKSRFIANPGCFATAIQLALLPLAKNKLLNSDVHIHAITGSTGAGGQLSGTTHFSWRNNNVSVYKPFIHQHLDEIKQGIHTLYPGFDRELLFIPVRGGFTRGIFASLYTDLDLDENALYDQYHSFYDEEKFVWISKTNIHLKQVINTNKCLIHLIRDKQKVLIISILDNLMKGAAGQAVQNMNLALGLKEETGLMTKAMAY